MTDRHKHECKLTDGHKHECKGCTGLVERGCFEAGGCQRDEDGATYTYALTAVVLWKSASAALDSRGQAGSRGHYMCAYRRHGLGAERGHGAGAERSAPAAGAGVGPAAGAGEWVLVDDEVVTAVSAADVGVSETEVRRGCGQDGGAGRGAGGALPGSCVGFSAGVPYLCVYTRVDFAHASEST